uniref:Uncharacterized protein n=1 Tax=Oryza sativa subsp. japonica TaxID=39947 RepID=Q2R272_ORYSJ|nr:hypothetical protein LOC_Os11g36780 [Oryza sativa Japonica Group]
MPWFTAALLQAGAAGLARHGGKDRIGHEEEDRGKEVVTDSWSQLISCVEKFAFRSLIALWKGDFSQKARDD